MTLSRRSIPMLLCASLALGCAASGVVNSSSSGTSAGGSSSGNSSGGQGTSGGSSGGACVPTIPTVPWTSPYAGWSNGISTDPSFFPLSVWLQGSWHATEMAGLGINIYLGNNAGTDPIATADIEILQPLGLYALIGQDATGLGDLPTPTIIGWWMSPDEPDNAQPNASGGYGPPIAPSVMVAQYQSYQTTDPTRPIFLGLGQGVAYPAYEGRGSNPPAESGYVPASDIIDFDIYPYNACAGDANQQVVCGQFWLNAAGVDNLRAWSNRHQAVWTDIETTSFETGSDAGPTPTQTVSEVWLSLIHGANGITYFVDILGPTFREDGIFADQAMVDAVTALNSQIEALAPELNSADIPNLVTVTSSNGATQIDLSVKANATSLYVFAAIARPGTTTGTFTIAGMTGNGSATVIGESRSVAVTAGTFSDAFAANAVHLYQLDLSQVTCP